MEIIVNTAKINFIAFNVQTIWFMMEMVNAIAQLIMAFIYHRVISVKNANRIANIVKRGMGNHIVINAKTVPICT